MKQHFLILLVLLSPILYGQDGLMAEMNKAYANGQYKKCLKIGSKATDREEDYDYQLLMGISGMELSGEAFLENEFPEEFDACIETAIQLSKLKVTFEEEEEREGFFKDLGQYLIDGVQLNLKEENKEALTDLTPRLSRFSKIDSLEPTSYFLIATCDLVAGDRSQFFKSFEQSYSAASYWDSIKELPVQKRNRIKNAGMLLSYSCLEHQQKAKAILIAAKLKAWLPSDEDIMRLFDDLRD